MTSNVNDVSFGTFDKSVLSEQIAQRLLNLIREKRLGPGMRLPSERELSVTMQVSRPSLREALRVLEAMNIVEIRQGAGTFITSLEPERLLENLDFVFSLSDVPLLELIEMRKLLEPGIAALAATRLSPEALERLEQSIIRSESNLDKFGQADLEFHEILAQATDNSLVIRVMKSLRALAQASRIVTTTSEDSARQAIDDHKKILQAIKEHDGQGASYMMMAHLLGVEWKLREMLTERDKHSSSSE